MANINGWVKVLEKNFGWLFEKLELSVTYFQKVELYILKKQLHINANR